MLFTRTHLLKTTLSVGMLAAVGASGSASARPLDDLLRLCCTQYGCYFCVDATAPPETSSDAGHQRLQSPLLAIVEDRCAREPESPQEDFAGIPYARS